MIMLTIPRVSRLPLALGLKFSHRLTDDIADYSYNVYVRITLEKVAFRKTDQRRRRVVVWYILFTSTIITAYLLRGLKLDICCYC